MRRPPIRSMLWALPAAQVALLVTLLLPWWTLDCDDGCTDGRTGFVTGHLPLDGRVVVAAALGVACVALAAAAHGRARLRRAAALAGLAAAALVASLLVVRPPYQNDPPIIDRLSGWGLAAGLAALSAVLALAILADGRPARGEA